MLMLMLLQLLQELEGQKEKIREMSREKQQAINELRESTDVDRRRQLDALREKIEQVINWWIVTVF